MAFYVDFFQVVVESLVQFGLWLWARISEAASAVKVMVEAAGEAFRQTVDWAVDWIIDLFSQSLTTIGLASLSTVPIGVHPDDGRDILNRSLINPDDAARSLARIILSGKFFYTLVGIGIAIQSVATYLSIQSLGTAALASGIILPKLIEVFLDAIFKTVVYTVISVAGIISIAGILYLIFPDSDSFWVEGLGLSVLSTAVALENLPAILQAGMGDLTGLAREFAGFALALVGLAFALMSDSVEAAWIGLVLAGIGTLITIFNKDIIDRNPFAPLRFLEETVSVVATAYAVTNLVDKYY